MGKCSLDLTSPTIVCFYYLYYNGISDFMLHRSLKEPPDHITFSRHLLYTSRKVLPVRDGCNVYKKILRIFFSAVIWLFYYVQHNFSESTTSQHDTNPMPVKLLIHRLRGWPTPIQ